LIAELICVSTGQAGADIGIGIGIGTTLNCDHEAPIVTVPLTQNPYADNESRESLLVTHALRADGFDASEDGTGRGTPLVPVAFVQNTRDEVRLFNGDGQTVGALAAEPGAKQQCYVAFDCKASGRNGFGVGEISPTLRSMGHKDTDQNGGGQVAVAFNLRGRDGGAMPECSDVASVRAASGGSSRSYVAQTAVRRLTPRECERLQGFPDDYTKISAKAADGPRYKALGNSMAVPVMRWIGERISVVESITEKPEK
jgi:DNA (cytosine-5)-methyltransferase 1